MEKISLGICCMEEKLKCTIMKYFIEKLKEYSEIDIIEFDTNTIFKKQINEWPIVDSFLCFYSNGFPLDKAIAYYELRRPYLVNDLHAQSLLQDRKKVNEILQDNDIPCPKSCYIIRDPITNSIILNGGNNSNNPTSPTLVQSNDYIEINGTRIYKPFIEKPFNSDDHNNYIYYPMSQGGGCRKLFRKIGNNSSDYFKDINTIRESGSYTYEEFFKIDNSKDVKVYSTKLFSYSELRKSPSVDGCVERNYLGKEKRTLTQLSDQEANISYKINKAFGQFVCGFDILRVGGKSFVCDVNGWSFVKGDHYKAFYDNSSKLLYEKLMKHFKILSNTTSSSATTLSSSAITSSIIISQNLPSSTNTSPEQPTFDYSPSTSPTNNNHYLPSSSSPLFNNNHKHHDNNNNNNNNNNNISNSSVTTPPHFDLISASAFDKHQDIQTTANNNRIYSSPTQSSSSSSSNHDIIDFENIHSLNDDTGSAT